MSSLDDLTKKDKVELIVMLQSLKVEKARLAPPEGEAEKIHRYYSRKVDLLDQLKDIIEDSK